MRELKPSQRTQRERLLDAMVQLAAQDGCKSVTVAQVSTLAGVSSATFYEQFDGKEACLLAAFQSVLTGASEAVEHALADEPDADIAELVLGTLLDGIQHDRDAGRLMFIEALAGGPALREALTYALESLEAQIEAVLSAAPSGTGLLDVPAIALVGAVRSIVARHLRTHSEDLLPSLLTDVLAWIHSYETRSSSERWSTGACARLTRADTRSTRGQPSAAALAPPRLPRGRHGLSASVVARSQRTRIIHATAEAMLAKGYANTTVSDIVAAAGVARDVFYQHFTDKQHAFTEAQQYPTQYMLETCVAAYFAEDKWPRRVWSGLKTLLELIAENPAQSHLRLVECYAAGADAARRAEEITRSFTIFLEEGYRYRPQAQELPRLCSQTIGGAVFEIIQRTVARGETADLPRYLPQLVYVAIAPFTGPHEARELLERLGDEDQGKGRPQV